MNGTGISKPKFYKGFTQPITKKGTIWSVFFAALESVLTSLNTTSTSDKTADNVSITFSYTVSLIMTSIVRNAKSCKEKIVMQCILFINVTICKLWHENPKSSKSLSNLCYGFVKDKYSQRVQRTYSFWLSLNIHTTILTDKRYWILYQTHKFLVLFYTLTILKQISEQIVCLLTLELVLWNIISECIDNTK